MSYDTECGSCGVGWPWGGLMIQVMTSQDCVPEWWCAPCVEDGIARTRISERYRLNKLEKATPEPKPPAIEIKVNGEQFRKWLRKAMEKISDEFKPEHLR